MLSYKYHLLLPLCLLASYLGLSGTPNIVFVFSDDHATQAISAYGGHLAKVALPLIWIVSPSKACDSTVAWLPTQSAARAGPLF